MSKLTTAWLMVAKHVAAASPGDNFFCAETADPRVPFERRAVVGGVVDGRAEKPGVLLVTLTTDGANQQLGVSTPEHAKAVMDALLAAWPDLRPAGGLVNKLGARLVETRDSLLGPRVCAVCSGPATCWGSYEHNGRDGFACDKCCGHGCEDGHCWPIRTEATR